MPAFSAPPPPRTTARRIDLMGYPRAFWDPNESAGTTLRDIVGANNASFSGTLDWRAGMFGRSIFVDTANGTTGPMPGFAAMTVTVAHWRYPGAAGTFPDILGWGDTPAQGQIGIGYTPTSFGLTSFNGSAINSVTLAYPVADWRIISVTMNGFGAGASIEYWADGVRIYTSTLAAALLPPSAGFRFGSAFNGNLVWRGSLGPIVVHDRVLTGLEISRFHGDIYAISRAEIPANRG